MVEVAIISPVWLNDAPVVPSTHDTITLRDTVNVIKPLPAMTQPMTLGRTIGFAIYEPIYRNWSIGGGKDSCNLGFANGFSTWSTVLGKWKKGGVVQ